MYSGVVAGGGPGEPCPPSNDSKKGAEMLTGPTKNGLVGVKNLKVFKSICSDYSLFKSIHCDHHFCDY